VLPSCATSGPQRPPTRDVQTISFDTPRADTPVQGLALHVPYRLPDVTLTADNGSPFDLLHDTAYPVTLIYFGYTHCPDVCPLVVSDVAAALRLVPPAVRQRVQLLFITADPARDRPAVLRGRLHGFNPTFVGLTNKQTQIDSLAHSLGVAIVGRKPLPGGGYDVGHSTPLLGFVGHSASVYWMPGASPSALAHDLTMLAQR